MLKIVLIGCVNSSALFLRALIERGYPPVGVVTKSKSIFHSDFYDLSSICKAAGIQYQYVTDVNDADSVAFIRSCEPDLIYCFGWSQLLKQEILSIPHMGAVGFHPTKLPHNRGRHPLIWALALGLEETASSFFMMDETADTGALISQKTVPIDYADNAQTLYDKILAVAVSQMLTFTKQFDENCVISLPQSSEKGNIWRKRGMRDGEIDWRMSSRAIYNLTRALTKPYPGAHFVKDGTVYHVWRVEEIDGTGLENIESGKVISVESPTGFSVKTYDNVIHVIESDPVELKLGEYLL